MPSAEAQLGCHTPPDTRLLFTYRPLSNLPTPPPSHKAVAASPSLPPDDGFPLLSGFRGPAIHLVNLIPSSASLLDASVSLVQAILSRARLPLRTVALAVCILDSLDSRFARRWRLSCPLPPALTPAASHRHEARASFCPYREAAQEETDFRRQQMLHIDSVRPELIILAALVIAAKFSDDPQLGSQFYCEQWGSRIWSPSQLNLTERCIMEMLHYRIMPLCEEDCLAGAMADMELAARHEAFPFSMPTPRGSLSPDPVLTPPDAAH